MSIMSIPLSDRVYLWPDNTSCNHEKLREYLGFMSDDFTVIHADDYDTALERAVSGEIPTLDYCEVM